MTRRTVNDLLGAQYTGLLHKPMNYLIRAIPEKYRKKIFKLILNKTPTPLSAIARQTSPSGRINVDFVHQRMQDNMSEILD